MRTNIDIDNDLMNRAMKLTGKSVKKTVVEDGLRLLVRMKEQEQGKKLRGKLKWTGDLDDMRTDR